MASVASILPLVSPIGLFGTNAVNTTTSVANTLALGSPGGFGGIGGGSSTIVQLSGLGQLLSAASTFASSIAVIQPGLASSGLGQHFGADFGSLAAEAQGFVDAFNTLQNTINGLQGFAGAQGGSPFATQLATSLDNQAGASFANGGSPLTTLAQIGITLQPPTVTGGGGTLGIDLATLQSAFNADQAGTFSLLGQAIASFSAIAGGFGSEAGSQFAVTGALAQAALTESLLGLSLNGGSFGSGRFDFTDLLALSSLSQGNASNTAQTILALNQFNFVQTLLD